MNVVPQNDTTLTNEFFESLNIFLNNGSNEKPDSSIFEFPSLSELQIMEVKKMIHDGVSISGCCRYLSSNFQFDPALVNAIINHELPQNQENAAIISSLIAWVGSDKYCTSDFFLLFINVIKSFKPNQLLQFCLKIIIDHYAHNIPHELSFEGISLLSNYFIKENDIYLFAIETLNSFLKISIKIKQSDVINLIFKTISIIIRNNDYLLANYDFPSILENCHLVIDSLSIDLLSLLNVIAETSQYSTEINKWFELLAETIIRNFSEAGTPLTTKIQTPTDKLSYDFVIDYQISFDSLKNHQQTLDSLQYGRLEPTITVVDALTTRQFEILNSFRTLLQIRQKKYVETFFLSYSKYWKESKKYIETTIFFVYLICKISNFEVPQSIAEDLINSEIFSPRFTIFYSEMDDFNVINLLRYLTMSFIIKHYPTLFTIALENVLPYPFLFTEVIARLHTVIPVREESKILNETVISDISTVLNTIMIKMSENLDDDLRKHVFSVWSTMFVSLNEFLSDSSLLVLLFSSYEFLNVYLRHFFDPSLRPIIFSTLRRYLVNPDSYLPSIAQFCLHFFSYAVSVNNEKLHAIITELLACLEDAIIHRPEILTDLSVITPAILSFFLHFPTKELLKNTLNFLLHVSVNIDNFTFSHDEMLALGNTIRSMENNGVSDQTFSIMLSLLAGTKITSLSTNFAIKNPSYILLIMYISADDISQSIQFFYRLCRYSIFNCVQCQIGKLDLLLIEHVRNYPKPFQFLDCTFNSSFSKEELSSVVLQLLSLIFTYQCSPQSIERFIGLAVPLLDTKIVGNGDDSNVFSTFKNINVKYPLFADNIMNQLIATTTNQHELRYVFTSSATPLTFDSISLSEIADGVTFSCFLIVDTAVSQKKSDNPILFKLIDSLNTVFLLYLSGSTLLCELRSVSSFSSISLTTEFPSCEWTMLTLVISKKKDKVIIIDFALNENQSQPFTVHDSYFTDQSLKAQIGGFLNPNESRKNIFSCLLGSFHLFNHPLDEVQVGSLYSIGLKSFEGTAIKDLFAKFETPTNLSIKSFLPVFRKYDLVQNFVPFFCFATQAPPFFIEKVVDFLHKAEIQQFDKYFSMISQFLTSASPSVITYTLYLRFYSLFIETQSTELFKHILFNFNIWFNAEDPLTVKRTVQHWNNVLFPGFPQTFLEQTTFSGILTLIRIHCYFKNDEINLINKKRCKSIDVNAIRNSLNHLLSKFASCRLDITDVRSLLSNIFTSHEIQHTLSLLNLLDQISSRIVSKSEVVDSLHFLFATDRPDLFSRLLQLILKFTVVESNILPSFSSNTSASSFNSRSSQTIHLNMLVEPTKSPDISIVQSKPTLLPPPSFNPKVRSLSLPSSKIKELEKHIEYVMFHMNKFHWTTEILDSVIEVSKQYPEALPLACLIASNLNEEQMLKTINSFASILDGNKSKKIRIKKITTWFIWPIILTLKVHTSKTYQVLMMNTIVSIMKNDYGVIDEVLAFLDLIYLPHGITVLPFQYVILDLLSIELLKHPERVTADTLYRFVRYLLFHFDCELHSRQLLDAYNESPFNESTKNQSNPEKVVDLNNMNDIVRLFSSVKNVNLKLRFRVDNNTQNIQLLTKILKNIDRLIDENQDYENLTGYVHFFKYLINKPFLNDEERFKALDEFGHCYHTFQAMDISFRKFFSMFVNDFERFLVKTQTVSNNLLTNLNEDIIRLSLTSVDLLHERNELQYARDVNFFNKFEYLFMNDFSIWNQFSKLFKNSKSFKLLENFSSPFLKVKSKFFRIQMDVFVEHGKPLKKKHCILIHFNHTEKCTFAILPKKVMIVTDFKCVNISVNEISYILYRSFNCFEFVTKNGKSYLVYFLKETKEDVLKALKQMDLPPDDQRPIIQSVSSLKFFNSLSITNDWVNRKLTNFEYLLKLNFLCGRTYQMIGNYPIFPFVRDFTLNLGYRYNPYIYLRLFHPFQEYFKKKSSSEHLIDSQSTIKQKSSEKVSSSTLNNDRISLNSTKYNYNESNNRLQLRARSTSLMSSEVMSPQKINEHFKSFTSSTFGSDNVKFDYSSDYTTSTNQDEDDSSPRNSSFDLVSSPDSLKSSSSDEIHLNDSFLTIYQLNKYELTPEFYDMPECFGTLKLPDGVSSSYEFVYNNRKQLESEEVSKTLHIWIDKIFGQTGIMPVFKTPHPSRIPLSEQKQNQGVIDKDYKLLIKIPVKHAHFGKIIIPASEKDKITLKVISMPGEYLVVQVDLSKKSIDLATEKKMKISPKTLFSSDGEDILVLDLEKEKMYSIQGFMMGKPIHSTAEFAEPESLFGTSDGFVFAVESNHHKISTLGLSKVSPQLIVVSTSSKQFDRTAVSTQNGEIILFERKTGQYVQSINTNGKTAKKLLFTPGFGFLIAEFPFELALYSLAGDLIRTVTINYEILYVSSFKSEYGFDYLVLLNNLGHINIFEAFTLQLIESSSHKINCSILDTTYVPSIGTLLILTEDGKLFSFA